MRTEKFDTAFEKFLEACKSVHRKYLEKAFADSPDFVERECSKPWRVDHGKVRARIVHDGSAYCFVDYATGNILKTDGWSRPAKHPRGSIYAEDNGASAVGPYGANYLR